MTIMTTMTKTLILAHGSLPWSPGALGRPTRRERKTGSVYDVFQMLQQSRRVICCCFVVVVASMLDVCCSLFGCTDNNDNNKYGIIDDNNDNNENNDNNTVCYGYILTS